MAAISGKVGAIYTQTSSTPTAFTNEAATDLGGTHIRYRITNSIKRYIDKTIAVTVKKNALTITTGFTFEYCGGEVVFDAPVLGTDVITVSGSYLPVSQLSGFFSWSADLSSDTADVTTFNSSGWKENLPTIKSFTASAESYWADDTFLQKLGTEVVIVLYVDSGTGKNRYEGFATISSDSIEVSDDGIIADSIEFEGNGSLYYREG